MTPPRGRAGRARSGGPTRGRSSFSPCLLYLAGGSRSEEHTSELQSRLHLVCRLLLEKKKTQLNKLLHTTQLHTRHIPSHLPFRAFAIARSPSLQTNSSSHITVAPLTTPLLHTSPIDS